VTFLSRGVVWCRLGRTPLRTAEGHYAAGRPPYPPAPIEGVADFCGFTRAHRVLDLGTGPRVVAIAFAPYVGSALAVDPEPEMLRIAREARRRWGLPVGGTSERSPSAGPSIGWTVPRRSVGSVQWAQRRGGWDVLHTDASSRLGRGLGTPSRCGGTVGAMPSALEARNQGQALLEWKALRVAATRGCGIARRKCQKTTLRSSFGRSPCVPQSVNSLDARKFLHSPQHSREVLVFPLCQLVGVDAKCRLCRREPEMLSSGRLQNQLKILIHQA
jgi:hypothetical protein